MHRIDHSQATHSSSSVTGDVTAGSAVVTNTSSTAGMYINAPVSVDVPAAAGMEFKIIGLTADTVTLDAPVPETGRNVLVEILGSRFTEGDPERGRARTVVTDSWANSVQEEIAQVIEMDRALDKTKPGQLADVIRAVVGRGITGLQVVPMYDGERVSISAGACLDSTGTVLMRNEQTVERTMGAYGTSGPHTSLGGLPSNLTATADGSYYVFMIKKSSGEVNFGFDTSESAENLLAETGYDYYRCIDVVRLTMGTGFLPYDLIGDRRILHHSGMFFDQALGEDADYDLTMPSLTPVDVEAFLIIEAEAGAWGMGYCIDRDASNAVSIYGADGEVVQIPIRFSARPDGKIRMGALSGTPKVTLRVISYTPQLP